MVYMITSVIMDGAKSVGLLSSARKIAQQEAVTLHKHTEYRGSDAWVAIYRWNTRTKMNTPMEEWKYNGKTYSSRKMRM